MNRKRLLAKILIMIVIFTSVVPSAGFVGASASNNSTSGGEQTTETRGDMPILSKDDDIEEEDTDTEVEDTEVEDTEVEDTEEEVTGVENTEDTDTEVEDTEIVDTEASDDDVLLDEASPSNERRASDTTPATESDLLDTDAKRARAGDNLGVVIISPDDVDDTQPGIQTKMQTFIDYNRNIQPPDFVLGLRVTNNATDLSGTFIEIPLDCVPDGAAPYTNYTMDGPVYSFDEGGSILADIIENCEIISDSEGVPETLRLHFKVSANQGVHSLFLRFKLNEDYYGNIPPEATSWIVTPSYYNGVNAVSLGIVEILTTAKPNESVRIERQAPTGSEFGGTSVQMLCTLNNLNPYEAWLKDGSYSYVAVPEGFTVRGSTTTAGQKTDLSALSYEGPLTEYIDGIPYLIYKKYHGNSQETWTNWDHNSVGDTFNRLYLEVITPPGFSVGSQFKVYYGSALTRQNGTENPSRTEVTYTKTETLTWVLEGNGYNAHSSGLPASCGIENGAVGTAALNSNWIHAGYNIFNHNSSTRNMGMGTGKNVRLELYSTNTNAARLNYNQVEVSIATGPYPDRITGPQRGTPGWFKVEFEIENALTGQTKDSGVLKSGNRTFTVTPSEMPVLEPNEFISKVIVTPMGDDGTKEGEWPPGNIIGVKYQPKAWPGQIWPDGTSVPNTPTPVTMKWTLYSDNDREPVKEGVLRSMTYLRQKTVSASAQMISTDSQNRGPGDTVTYTLNGYNDLARIGNPWVEPYLIIAVPKVLQLKDPGLPKVYTDLVDNGNGTKEVNVNKMILSSSSSTDFDFYEIRLDEISQKAKRNAPAFSIPLEFQVVDSASPGTYRIPFVIVSQRDKIAFSQIGFALNNLGSNIVNPVDLGFEGADNYTAIMSGHTNLTIIRNSEISADVNIRTDTTQWSNLDELSVSPGENVEMRLSLQNTGNVTFNGVKLYNILPYDNDSRGSSGDIIFTGIEGVPATADVWYATEPLASQHSYSAIDLATFDPAQDPLFSSTEPTDLNTVTAIYIDFKESRIEPSKALAPIIKFKIPGDTEESTAYNQFKYIVYDEDTNAVVMHTEGSIKGFSTEGLNLVFTTGADESITINNMPASVSKLREQTPEDIVIPTGLVNTPTRIGYTFQGWDNKEDGVERLYQPGETVSFAEGVNRIVLEAQWKALTINVTYDVNGGEPFNPPLTPSPYQYDQVLTKNDLPQPEPVRAGYRFKGWSTRYVSDTADFGVGTKIQFTADMTVYAVWEELYTVTVSQQTAGAFADKTLVFDYKVTFNNPDGSGYEKEVKYKRWVGETVETGLFKPDSTGEWNFTLAEGQSICFQYFAKEDEISYKILETLKDRYKPYVNATIGPDGKVSGGEETDLAEGKIGADEKHNAEVFINERTDVPVTGIAADNTSSHLLVWIAGLSLLLFSMSYLYLRRKRTNKIR